MLDPDIRTRRGKILDLGLLRDCRTLDDNPLVAVLVEISGVSALQPAIGAVDGPHRH